LIVLLIIFVLGRSSEQLPEFAGRKLGCPGRIPPMELLRIY
jgi:hypothetical protein